jgi:cellulose biosynthesis protein BcsQ
MVLPTLRPNLHLLPAFGLSMRVAERAEDPGTERWRELLERLRAQADLILIDTGAGLYGHTASILAAATYVLGVVQAEPLSARLADRFQHVLPGLAGGGASLLGLVVNMVAPDSTTSVEALEAVAARHQGELFATGIPRTGSIPSASRAGGPALADDPALAGIFEDLAAEICARLEQRMASTTTSLKPPTGERT